LYGPSFEFSHRQLEALGVRFVLSTSTEDALAKTLHRTFDAIISDMGRPPDARAGYTLLDALRKRGDQTPFIIYAGSRLPEHVAEARRRGAVGCTNRPQELIEMVLEVLR
jgi:CheY-like chemotaxis protein